MIEVERESRVDDPARNVDAKVDFQDIIGAEYDGVAGVGGVMSGAMVETDASGEADASVQAIHLDQSAGAVLDHFRDLRHGHPGLDSLADVFPYLSMYLGGASNRVIILWRVRVLLCRQSL